MTTPRIRSLVSLAVALTAILSLGGCAAATSRVASGDEAAATDELPNTFRFDNDALSYVHVYLVSEKRQWLLGRVEPGARATLRMPEEALAGSPEMMRLAVLAGQPVNLRAAAEARAATSILQPMAEILRLRWSFSVTPSSGGQLMPQAIARPRALVGRQ